MDLMHDLAAVLLASSRVNALTLYCTMMPQPLEMNPNRETEFIRPLHKPTLLIVDDEEGPRQSLRVVFKDDYQLLLAGDGATAIQLAQAHRIDVAVLDVRMAGMSGIEVL